MIDAVSEDLSVTDPEMARVALRRHWLRLILESRTRELEHLCLTHPDSHDPSVLLIRACCRDLLGDSHGAVFLRGQGLRIAEDDFVARFTELLLATDTVGKAAAADRAREALTRCGPDDDYPSALFLLGWTEVRLRRDLANGIGLLRSAAEEARLHGRRETFRLAQSNLAFALTHAGLFTEAEQTLDDLPLSPSPTDWDLFEGGLPPANRGTIAYWRGNFDDAVAHLDSVVAEDGPGNNFEALSRLYLVMSLVALKRQDRFYAASGLLDGVSKADKHGVPWDTLRRVVSALLAHAEGHDERARSIAAPALTRPGAAVAHAVLAELYRVLEEPALSAQALRLASAGALPRYARVSTLVTTAALRSASGHGADAHAHIDRALEAAIPEHILAPFLSDDPPHRRSPQRARPSRVSARLLPAGDPRTTRTAGKTSDGGTHPARKRSARLPAHVDDRGGDIRAIGRRLPHRQDAHPRHLSEARRHLATSSRAHRRYEVRRQTSPRRATGLTAGVPGGQLVSLTVDRGNHAP